MNFWENGTRGGNDGHGRAGNYNSGNFYGNDSGARGYGGDSMQDDIAARLSRYSGKSEEQLMQELRESVQRMKADGTFDPASIDNLYNTAYPLLNEAQRQRMRYIIDMLKG